MAEITRTHWPENDAPARFATITDPICDAIRFAYKLERQNRTKDIPWSGLDIGERQKATCFSPDVQLTADNLAYSENDQGRDALRELVGLAVALGIEQGRRLNMQDMSPHIQLLGLVYKALKNEAKNDA